MEEIIHYRGVNERFYYTTSVEHSSPDEDPFTNIPIASANSYHTTEKIFIDNDEFKKRLSEDKQVFVQRDTIVISEDYQKNTISLKFYLSAKKTVKVKTLKRKVFKKTIKYKHIISINKSTGEFTICVKNAKNNFVRQNIMCASIKNYINEFLNIVTYNDIDTKKQFTLAYEVFYQKLGYSNITTINDLIKSVYNIDHTEEGFSLMYLLLINYLKKSKIELPDFYLLPQFFELFKKNKKKYYGKTMSDFITDHYQLKNKIIVDELLVRLNELNSKTLNKKRNLFANDNYLYINPVILKILDLHFNASKFIVRDEYFTNTIYTNYQLQLPYVIKILKIYKDTFTLNDILKFFIRDETKDAFTIAGVINENNFYFNSEFEYLLTALDNLYSANIIIKDPTNIKIVQKISKALSLAIEHTGTFTVDKKLINRLKRFLKAPKKIILATEEKVVDFKYKIGLQSKSETFYFKYNKHANNFYHINNYDSSKELQSLGNKLSSAFNLNQNLILETVKVNYLYSKDFFEQSCKYILNCDDIKNYLVYLENND